MLDSGNSTLSALCGFEKDNAGNIMSVLVYNGYIPPSLLICPNENNFAIQADKEYQFRSPERAVVPVAAVFDPGLASHPGESGTGIPAQGRRGPLGNMSYAINPPFGGRSAYWRNSLNATEPVIANRGPMYDGEPGAWHLRSGVSGTDSLRLKVFGGPHSWEGNVGYNDTHVSFAKDPDPDLTVIQFSENIRGRRQYADNLFVNETDRAEPEGDQFSSSGSSAMLKLYSNVYCTPSGIIITPFID
jgi:hypothetical protein